MSWTPSTMYETNWWNLMSLVLVENTSRLLMQLERFAYNSLDEEKSLRALSSLQVPLAFCILFMYIVQKAPRNFTPCNSHFIKQICSYIQMVEIRISCAPASYYIHFWWDVRGHIISILACHWSKHAEFNSHKTDFVFSLLFFGTLVYVP